MKKEIVIKCLAEALGKSINELSFMTDKTELSELGLTSIGFISFIVNLEEAFGIEIRDSDLVMDKFKTFEVLNETLSAYVKPSADKKVLILDADGVLWRGIAGEDEIRIDDDIIRFQESLIKLYERGVLLCLCSKNDPQLIEAAFNLPAMIIHREHFIAFVANRRDKASNIMDISDELGLSTDQFVFADDSDYELDFVKLSLPDVEVVKINHENFDFDASIGIFFENVQPTTDLNRTKLYREQKEREKSKRAAISVSDYNASLCTKVSCTTARYDELARISELSNRTHQFNLSARSYTTEELAQIFPDSRYTLLALSASDKFGDMGIVGAAIANENTIEAFMLSCRAFDRGFENVMVEKLRELLGTSLFGIYSDNGKNSRFADFYSKNGIETI